MSPPSSTPDLPAAVYIFDTTLRDGSQLEGISLTVDDKLRVAEQLDHLGVQLDRGRLAPVPTPRTTSSSGGRPSELHPQPPPTLTAFGSTRRPARARSTRIVTLAATSSSAEHLRGVHRRQVLGLPRHRGAAARPSTRAVAMVADSVQLLRRARACRVLLRRRALLRRVPAATPEFSPAGAGGRHRVNGASTASCCATPTAGRCPSTCERITVGEVLAHFGSTT